MKQAKVLTAAEMKRMLAVIASRRHAERNRLAVMFSHLAGLRVGEIAGLTFDLRHEHPIATAQGQ